MRWGDDQHLGDQGPIALRLVDHERLDARSDEIQDSFRVFELARADGRHQAFDCSATPIGVAAWLSGALLIRAASLRGVTRRRASTAGRDYHSSLVMAKAIEERIGERRAVGVDHFYHPERAGVLVGRKLTGLLIEEGRDTLVARFSLMLAGELGCCHWEIIRDQRQGHGLFPSRELRGCSPIDPSSPHCTVAAWAAGAPALDALHARLLVSRSEGGVVRAMAEDRSSLVEADALDVLGSTIVGVRCLTRAYDAGFPGWYTRLDLRLKRSPLDVALQFGSFRERLPKAWDVDEAREDVLEQRRAT